MVRKAKAAAQNTNPTATPKMPRVNVNDGFGRVIVTMKKDGTGIEAIGRYGVAASVATTLLVEALPFVRAEEVNELLAEREAIVQRVEEVIGKMQPVAEAEEGVMPPPLAEPTPIRPDVQIERASDDELGAI